MSTSTSAAFPSYREQYDRVKRWYERCAAINQGRVHEAASDNYVDEIYAFFLNCYHLKDWIIADPAALPTNQRVENYINSSTPLKLCADICNSLKHLRLTHPPRSGENPVFGKKHFAVQLGPGDPTRISLKYEIDTKSGPVDAFELATECVAAWNAFLSTNGL